MPQTKVQRMEIGGQLYDIIVPKNWNQSDYTAVDYIENRTHYIIPQKNNDGSLAQLLITAGAGQFGNLLTKFSPKLTIGDWVLIETETDNAVENPETGIIQPATARYEISKLIRVGSSENNALTFDYEGTCTASIEVQAGANAADDVKFSGFIIRNENGERDSSKKFKYAIKISKVEVSPLAAAYIPLDEESLTINNAGKISTVRQDELRYSGTINSIEQINSEWVYNVAIDDSSDKSELAKVFLSEYKKEYPTTLADVSNFNKNLTLRFHTKGGTGYFIKATSQFTSDDKVEIDNRDNRVLPKDAIEALNKDSKQYLLHIDTANITGNSETHIQKNILDGLCFIVGPGCNTGHVTGDNDNCFELQAGDLVVILNGEPIRLRSTTNLALAPGSAQGALRGGAIDTSSITALSLYSFAYGYANFAGGKGFKIVGQSTGETAGTGTYTLTSVDGIEDGQNYIVRLSSVSSTLSGKILAVNAETNTVEVDNYDSSLVIAEADYNFEENQDYSTNASACNYLCIQGRPELGDISVGFNAFAVGEDNIASERGAVSFGRENKSLGQYAFTEGYLNEANYSSHAEGHQNKASGVTAHAEGREGTASGYASHSEGARNTASGEAAHAEGYQTVASGAAAHAEGYNTTASGIGAHAEGSGTTASGDASHASGVGTKATANYQTVIGKYNKEDSDALFIVGCGIGDATNQRANALTVDGSNKKTTLFGSLEVNGTSTLQDSLIVADNKTTTLGGDVTVKGNLVVETNKATTLNGTLQVNGDYKTQLGGELAVDGPTVLNNTLNVTGATTLNDNLSVAAGKSTALGGPLTVASGQSTSLGGALTVAGATTLTDSLAVTKATTIADTLEVSKATTLKGNLTVESGKTTTLGGATTIKGAFTVANNKEASLTGSLKVTGKTELSNMLTVAEGTILSKTLEVTGKTTLKGGLDVSKGSIKLTDEANNITISGNNGTLTVDNALTATQISSTGILSTTGGLTASGGAISLNAGANGVTISGNITTINRYTTVTDTDLTTKIVNAEKLCIGSNYKNSDSDALLVVGNGTETEPNTAFVVKPDGTGYLNNRKILVEGTNEGSLESNSITTKQLIIGDTELPESILVKLIQIAKSVEFEGASGGAEVYI